jgi:hypothetical protein
MHLRFVTVLILTLAALAQTRDTPVQAPRFWNDRELADWALPLAGLNVRPLHYSEADYYAAPDGVYLRTYPVYFPGREPDGYWDAIRGKKPEALVNPGARTASEWVADGKRAFEELDLPSFRTTDPQLIAIARSLAAFAKRGGHAQKNGTVFGLRWVPTAKGVALGVSDCSGCHTRVLPDGSLLDGAPFNDPGDGLTGEVFLRGIASLAAGESLGQTAWRQYGVPWVAGDIHEQLKTMSDQDLPALFASNPPGTFARANGSPYYPTQVPDLIGIRDHRYIDHTGTHQLRGPADIMRYAALVSCCDPLDFGPHRMLRDAQRRIVDKIPDHLAYALAQYLWSLEPPPNPNLDDPRAARGRQVFEGEGCSSCHTPPLYTNNKLTPATGFAPAADHPHKDDMLPVSVGTDPGLALRTRK